MQKMPGELIANRNQLPGLDRIRVGLTIQLTGAARRQTGITVARQPGCLNARKWECVDTTKLKQFLADESGATAIEYGLTAAGISLAIISIVNGLGSNLKTKFTAINASLK